MRLQGLGNGIGISIILMSALAWATADDGQPENGLSSLAFRRNALTTNKKALEILSSHALDDALLVDHGGYIARQLRDSGARAVMTEIVKCALDGTTTIGTIDQRDLFRGELGVCQDWHEHAPGQACQELVTACVMARVNGLHKAIPIALRGYPTEYPSDGPVRPTKFLRESPLVEDPAQGFPISSFLPVPCGPDGDCNWQPGYVGKCHPGDPIALRLEAEANAGWQVRVCAGIHGCTASTSPGGVGAPPYSWRIGEFSQPAVGNAGLLSFTCPSGLLAGGYYSVMLRNGSRPAGNGPVVRTNSGVYPAPLGEVFGFLEGAFFGNMFLPDKLTRDCEVMQRRPDQRDDLEQMTCRSPGGSDVTEECMISCGITSCRRDAGGLPYTNVHACYSIAQQRDHQNGKLGVAYLNSRLCDRPDATCFVEPPGPCTGDEPDSARCSWQGAAGRFADCSTPGDHSKEFPPITTYLNEPCDLIGEGALCDEVRRGSATPSVCHWTPLCVVGGGVLLVLLAAVLLWRFIDRRQARRG